MVASRRSARPQPRREKNSWNAHATQPCTKKTNANQARTLSDTGRRAWPTSAIVSAHGRTAGQRGTLTHLVHSTQHAGQRPVAPSSNTERRTSQPARGGAEGANRHNRKQHTKSETLHTRVAPVTTRRQGIVGGSCPRGRIWRKKTETGISHSISGSGTNPHAAKRRHAAWRER